MFCERCGRENENGKKFCKYCGAPLTAFQSTAFQSSGQPAAAVRKQKSSGFRMKPLYWAILIEGVLLVLLLVGGFLLGKRLCGPENTVKSYARALLDGDWEKAYSCLDLDESAKNKSMYLMAKASEQPQEYSNLSVQKEADDMGNILWNQMTGSKSSDAYETYEVRCLVEGETEKSEVTVVRTGKKKFFFFDEWKVVPDSLYGTDVTVTVPEGSEILMNGQTLDTAVKVSDDNGRSVYEIPELYYGTYQVEIGAEGMESYKALVDYQGYGDAFNFYYVWLMPDQETRELLMEQMVSDLTVYLDSSLKGQDFDTIYDLFTREALKQGEMEYEYEYLSQDAYDSAEGYGITGYEISDISICFLDPRDSYQEDSAEIFMELTGRMTTHYAYDGQEEAEEYDRYWNARYSREDGEWKLETLW